MPLSRPAALCNHAAPCAELALAWSECWLEPELDLQHCRRPVTPLSVSRPPPPPPLPRGQLPFCKLLHICHFSLPSHFVGLLQSLQSWHWLALGVGQEDLLGALPCFRELCPCQSLVPGSGQEAPSRA